ncbi:hypothetical protein V1525DRAFT_434354 [Lipomyces kononenkoae]|uniref:Uncharacterized protein n=1 Tax=Lipomyces kononenkoae TaxID=34357 RepID=A0ACC3SVV5_LIPKO
MPIMRRYVRLSPRDTILARIFLNQEDSSYFTTPLRQFAPDRIDPDNQGESISSAPSRLHSVFRAIQPIVRRRLREQKRAKGISVARVVGDRVGIDRQSTLEHDTTESNTIPGVVIRESAVGSGTGDVISNRGEGWECSLFLVKDRSKQSVVLTKDVQLIPWRSQNSKKRKRVVIDVDEDGTPADMLISQEEQDDNDALADQKPEMRTSYTGYEIYGKTLYLVLRRIRVIDDNVINDTLLWGDVNVGEDGNHVHEFEGNVGSGQIGDAGDVTDGGIVDWIGTQQNIQPSEVIDFEAR